MKIDITSLDENSLFVDKELEVDEERLNNLDIKKVNINIKGYINKISDNMFKLNVNIQGNLYLTCALCLEEVVFPINININSVIEKNIEKDKNLLDIFDVIWENILLEVPNKVTHDNCNIKISGNGWTFIKE